MTAIPADEIREAFNRLYFKLKHHGDQIFQTMIRYSVKIRKGRMLWNEEYGNGGVTQHESTGT